MPVTNINGGLDDALSQYMQQVRTMTTLTEADKVDIALAGALVFKHALEAETRAKHYSDHHDVKYGHAADHIELMKAGDLDGGTSVGAYVVGWKYFFHAMNMMRLNDGTKSIPADHFLDHLRHNPELRAKIVKAEREKYNEIVSKKAR